MIRTVAGDATAFDGTYLACPLPLFHNHSNQDYDKEESSRRLRRRDQNGWSPHRSCTSPLPRRVVSTYLWS